MFSRLKAGIARTRDGLLGGLSRLIGSRTRLDAATLDDIETLLLRSDVGVRATTRLVDAVRKIANKDTPATAIEREMRAILEPCQQPLAFPPPGSGLYVLLVVGVNGVGKTTTIAKMARRLKDDGYKVMLAAGDTFRAAAVEQLRTWGERLGIPVIAQAPGADPAAVVFDACQSARSRGIDVLIADTAGRLHTQDNLMAELAKVRRVIGKHDASAPHETLLVLDATMGQNAINQAEQFLAAVEVTGLALTKLDGTARGGVIFALAERFGLPIRYVGVGEAAEDLQVFEAASFVEALLGDFGRTDAETA
ncbi:MAG: signal recognition particle-docking protein FtsY [Gammaproteobacteria bacterium]